MGRGGTRVTPSPLIEGRHWIDLAGSLMRPIFLQSKMAALLKGLF